MRYALVVGVLVVVAGCGTPETEIGPDGTGIVFRGQPNGVTIGQVERAGYRVGYGDRKTGAVAGPRGAFEREYGRPAEGDAYEAFETGYKRGFQAARGGN